MEGACQKGSESARQSPGCAGDRLQLKRRDGSRIVPISVVGFDDETVTLDANGASLDVHLVIVEVRDALKEELESGKVQDMEALDEKAARVDGVALEFMM